ncbi:MAG TPA: hypothetical protein VGK97_01165 [Spongiibacteraceae bacterium]
MLNDNANNYSTKRFFAETINWIDKWRKSIALIAIFALCCSAARATDEGLVDPTRPPNINSDTKLNTETPADAMKLSLIRLGAEPLAVINGRNVQPGEIIDGYRLLSLQSRSATLAGSSGHIVLQLTPALRKSIATSPPHSLPQTR